MLGSGKLKFEDLIGIAATVLLVLLLFSLFPMSSKITIHKEYWDEYQGALDIIGELETEIEIKEQSLKEKCPRPPKQFDWWVMWFLGFLFYLGSLFYYLFISTKIDKKRLKAAEDRERADAEIKRLKAMCEKW